MKPANPPMHVNVITSKRNGKSYRTVLVRSSYRDQHGKPKKKTHANLTGLPQCAIDAVRRVLRGEQLVDLKDALQITSSRKHGAVLALVHALRKLDVASLLSSQPGAERDLVCAMIAARIIRPHTKLATWRWWTDTTLQDYFHIADAEIDDLYRALDWLLKRQNIIEGKLVRRHLQPEALALFDMTSTYMEGVHCPLAEFGYNKDGKKGKLQVNFTLLCDLKGRPLSVHVCQGSLRDNKTLIPHIQKLKKRFGLQRLCVVGDRGMVTQVNIDALSKMNGIEWISALKNVSIRKLVRKGGMDPARFDEVNLFEIMHPDYPGERLIACRNPALAQRRAHVRESLIASTAGKLDAIVKTVASGRLCGKAEIAMKVGEQINAFKVKKHFICEITDASLSYRIDEQKVAIEAALDGVYVIRTSLDENSMSGRDCVRSYKHLARVERAFRSIKTVSLRVRPVHHRTAERVRAHIFLCMLAFYVEWHMRQAWKPLLFSDPQLDQINQTRDPVAPLKRSAQGRAKALTQQLDDSSPVYCFTTLIEHLETIVRNRCLTKTAAGQSMAFELDTPPNDKQRQALDLLNSISCPSRKNKM